MKSRHGSLNEIARLATADDINAIKYLSEVVHVTHTWNQLYDYYVRMEILIKTPMANRKKKILHKLLPGYINGFGNETSFEAKTKGAKVQLMKDTKKVTELIVYIGMPLLLTYNFHKKKKKYKANDVNDSEGKNGNRCIFRGMYDTVTNIAYRTDYDLSKLDNNNETIIDRANNAKEKEMDRYGILTDIEIMIMGKVKTKKDVIYTKKMEVCQCDYNDKGKYIRQYQYPFLYGYGFTAMKVQGMTMKYLETDIKYFVKSDVTSNTLRINGYFYVILTRVKDLSSIRIKGLNLFNKHEIMSFVNCQSSLMLEWEVMFKELALNIESNVQLKYKDKVALYNMLGHLNKKSNQIDRTMHERMIQTAGQMRSILSEISIIKQLSEENWKSRIIRCYTLSETFDGT